MEFYAFMDLDLDLDFKYLQGTPYPISNHLFNA
jgi:hypothetical protein